MKTRYQKIAISVFTSVLLLFFAFGFVMNLGLIEKPNAHLQEGSADFDQYVDEVQKAYTSNFFGKEWYINLNGLYAKWTGRNVYNNIARLKNGMLTHAEMPKLNMQPLANALIGLNSFLQTQKIPYLYVQAPFKNTMDDSLLPSGVVHYANKNTDELLNYFTASKLPYLDLRPALTASAEDVERYFFQTDHHWNSEGAFVAFGALVDYLNQAFPKQIDTTVADIANWKVDIYENWFLGSHGKRVGEYYAGVDDLSVFTPKFKTDMSTFIPKHRQYFRGDYTVANLRTQYLDAPNYFDENPYCVYIGGDYPITHHINYLAKNDIKVLLIKDSYTLPVEAMLSTAVRELDVIDPRHFTESTVAEYALASQPDIVITMMNPSSFGTDKYRKTGVEKATALVGCNVSNQDEVSDLITVTATQEQNCKFEVIATELQENAKYTIQIDRATVTKGDCDAFTLALYDADSKRIIHMYAFDIASGNKDGGFSRTFFTPSGKNLQLLVYAGVHSHTNGNEVQYAGISLTRWSVGGVLKDGIAKLTNGMLTYEEMKKVDMTPLANELSALQTSLKDSKTKLLYVQAPFKNTMDDSLLPDGMTHYANQNAESLLEKLNALSVPYLDLRPMLTADAAGVEKYFFKTDHHWNAEGAFVAFGELIQYLNTAFPGEIDTSVASIENWKVDVYEDWFLGSHGRTVGVSYAGVDNLSVYTPRFPTDISCFIPKIDFEKRGSYTEANLRLQYLQKPNYSANAYCVYIGSDYPIVQHTNYLVENDLRVLILKDSFTLPVQAMLSTAVRQLDVIDPRWYRDTTIADYINQTQPDVVIMMINPSVFSLASYSNLGV